MEWSGQQQIQRLLQSAILGVLQGFVLDVLTAFFANRRKRWLWTDVLFGPVAAIITFLGALVIMDGQLHPILLLGVFAGMVLEHVSIGSLLRSVVRRVLFWLAQSFCFVCCVWRRMVVGIGKRSCLRAKAPKNTEKQRKMCLLFQKRT